MGDDGTPQVPFPFGAVNVSSLVKSHTPWTFLHTHEGCTGGSSVTEKLLKGIGSLASS